MLPTLLSKGKRLSEEHLQVINDEFTREDVKRIMFSIPDERDPGADGFNSKFYKHCQEIVGEDMADAILDFFESLTPNPNPIRLYHYEWQSGRVGSISG